ncbi:MAG: Heavy-chain fibroin (Fragment) [uncultured Paraburkholderia sp.]
MQTMLIAKKLKDWTQVAVTVVLVSALAACGGDSGGSSSTSGSTGGSSNGTSTSGLPASPTQQPIAATASNTVAISVGRGVTGVINIPTISVTVCVPNTTTCQTINNIQVDTGSFGLRIANAALNSTMQNGLQASTIAGNQLAECATFADGYTWGTVRTATVTIGGETTTAAVPVQIIGDKDASTTPASGCGSGSAENTPSDLGANGIIGIGTALYDCGSTCANASTAATYSNYFSCPGGTSCTRATVPLASQVANPVAKFPVDNNGVIVQMPPISNNGQASATGTLVFGIGTQSNNGLGSAQVLTTDAYGDLTGSVFNGSTTTAFLDSGSNGYFFNDSSLTLCGSSFPGFYCPSSAQTRSITLVGANAAQATASIGILSASTLFNSGTNYAFNDLAGQLGGLAAFDMGLPFFYGRHVYHGFDLRPNGGTQAPFVAYAS